MKNFLWTFSFLIAFQITAQTDIISNSGHKFSTGSDISFSLLNKITFGNLKGQIKVTDDNLYIDNHEGSPMLLKQWGEGTILFTDGKKITYPYLNYDALSDHFIIYFKKLAKDIKGIASTKLPIAGLNDHSIVHLQLYNGKKPVKFIKLNPILFLHKPESLFFEYFSEDPAKVYVVKRHWKNIRKNPSSNSPLTDSAPYKFMNHYAYYIKNKDRVFEKTKLKKKKILQTLKDKSAENALKAYAKKEHLSWSKPEDVQKILAYYFENLKRS